jgi:hypothetical protein
MILDSESLALSAKALALKPEKTTICVAPILAHASIAIVTSGTIGR